VSPSKKVPEYGDPEILPLGRIERPTRTRMPFDNSGVRLPNGAPIQAVRATPDIAETMDYVRNWPADAWSDITSRAVILKWMADLFKAHGGLRKWRIEERLSGRSSMAKMDPYIKVAIWKLDGSMVEASSSFSIAVTNDPTALRAKLDLLTVAIQDQL
jgi:hypothetical protein